MKEGAGMKDGKRYLKAEIFRFFFGTCSYLFCVDLMA
jgi:hypothetical protein